MVRFLQEYSRPKGEFRLDILKLLAELRQAHKHMTQAIDNLEQIEGARSNNERPSEESRVRGAVRKRGRPLGSKNKCAARPGEPENHAAVAGRGETRLARAAAHALGTAGSKLFLS